MWETDAFVKLINYKMKPFYPKYSKILGSKCEQVDKPAKKKVTVYGSQIIHKPLKQISSIFSCLANYKLKAK